MLTERLFWRISSGVPLTRRPDVSEVWNHFYPEIRESGVETASRPGSIEVLLLGGSVLQQAEGAIQAALREKYGNAVRVYSLARSAHTSRDSYWKSQRLAARMFDLVIVYDGINDARMNCCPKDVYRDDYTHCVWYRELARRLAAGRVTIPDLVSDVQAKGLALERPTEAELDFGLDVKTANAFRSNLEAILDRAHAPGQKTVLMTFATDIPSDYSRKEFERGGFGYGKGGYHLAVELWGRPEGVRKAMVIQNAIIHELAKGRDDVILVDQDRLLKKDGSIFCDPCHLTDVGCRAFAANIMAALPDRLFAQQ